VTGAARRAIAAALCVTALAACGPLRRRADWEAALRSRRLMVPIAGVRPEDVPDTFDDLRDGGKRRHHALDIFAPRGTPIVSADDGIVLAVGASRLGGRSIYATDPDGRFVYYYAHLDRHHPGLRAGAEIVRGQVLGEVGTTGNAPRTAPHLHFQVTIRRDDARWWAGTPIDPRPFLVAPGRVE
jgi:murein DD-endopeptidase MepM/ murein hydrolase activator NlpD